MTSDTENNPCCRKKGTLVITIEPCTKGKDVKPDENEFYRGDKYVPDLPYKTPRTMEIEVKIKGKDQELFSEEELSPVLSLDVEETELIIHSPEDEEESSEESKKSEEHATLTCSTRTIPLGRKPCVETCPGPLICLPRKHFFGDNCKLHDPTLIGNQILAMHKNGIIQKRLYTSERIYPDHILSAISEIKRKQGQRHVEKEIEAVSGDKGDVVEEKVAKKKPASLKEDAPREAPEIVAPTEPPKDDQAKRNRSGCYC